ncbi:MAG: tyrosine-type recombinase/integrase [Gammaproteobacteria bacterium]|nr:tyrosine-type recombinase/integrase [Gammaproteobacteria bacterium]MDP2346770.1 tyrosine-type recombinase/integrase [Gammaproteobacteria bacterium]
MDKRVWPTGVGPSGRGIRIKIWKEGRLFHSETIPGDPYKPADLAAAVRRREWLESRKRLGLALHEEDNTATTELFSEVAQEYLNTLDVKRSTAEDYLRTLNSYWLPVFGNCIKTEISTRMIKRELSKAKVSAKTKKNILIPLKGVFDHGEVAPNPVNKTILKAALKKHQKPKIERYSLDERKALIEGLEGEAQVYFAVLFGCGLRPGENLGLKWSDFNGTHLEITKQITRRRFEPTTKTSYERKVFVPTWVRPFLNNHVTRFKNTYIYLNTVGTPHLDTDRFNEKWTALHERLKFKYRKPYTCRHTRAAELLSTGVDPADAAKEMGHSLEMFFRIYAEWIAEYANKKDDSRLEGATDKKPTKAKGGI